MAGIAPAPGFPERVGAQFELGLGFDRGRGRGPLRFEEGVATDTDIPSDFARGAYADTAPASARFNHPSPESMRKDAAETMRERAHVGSASWIEAPTVLSEFVQGAVAGDQMPAFERSYNSGTHMNRPAATKISDF